MRQKCETSRGVGGCVWRLLSAVIRVLNGILRKFHALYHFNSSLCIRCGNRFGENLLIDSYRLICFGLYCFLSWIAMLSGNRMHTAKINP